MVLFYFFVTSTVFSLLIHLLNCFGFNHLHDFSIHPSMLWEKINCVLFDADVVVIVAVIILVGLFSVQHYGTDRVGWLFAPIVLLWFLLVGGIGIFNIWKYDSSVLRAFSPVYIYRYFRRRKKDSWTSLGGIMLSITGFILFTNISLNCHISIAS